MYFYSYFISSPVGEKFDVGYLHVVSSISCVLLEYRYSESHRLCLGRKWDFYCVLNIFPPI